MSSPSEFARADFDGVGARSDAPSAQAAQAGLRSRGPVPQLTAYPGPPGPFAGPNSRIDYADGKNNGTDLAPLLPDADD